MIDIYNNPHWILSANVENFNWSIEYNLTWGVQDKWYPQWRALEKDNIIFFYISGVKKIVGVGKIKNKFIQREPLWPDEISEGIVKYPLRFEFSLEYLLQKEQWNRGIDVSDYIKNVLGKGAFADLLRGGINFIRDSKLIEFLYKEFKEKLNYEILITTPKISYEEKVSSLPEDEDLHNLLKDLINEIGRMNRFLSEKEYSADGMRFDVVWRRVDKGSPSYVFEVQVGGDVYRALAKLKHAFDLWNSNVFLVISSNNDFALVQNLLRGTFHEIQNKVKIILSDEIKELFNRKKSWIDYEKKLGIL